MKNNRWLGFAMVLPFCGCLTNYYEQYYVDTEGQQKTIYSKDSKSVELKIATTEEEVLDLIEDGYASIGYSSFTGPYTPMSLAVDTAKKHGATLALLDIKYKTTKQYTSVMFLPSYSTSYSQGTVSAAAFGSSGSMYGYGSYSGTTTTTTVNAVPVQREMQIYSHDAMFFREIDVSGLYGIKLFVPKRLPTEEANSSIQVRVMAVFRGTQADRDGIKRGQIVKSINGKKILTRKDILPYEKNIGLIKSVEVEDEK